MDMSEVERAVSIDKYNLDEAWVEHPTNVLRFVEAAVEAERVLARLELRKDVLEATLDEQLRQTATERVTEAVLRNYLSRQPEYQEIEHELIEAKYELSMHKAIVRALEHTKKGLEKLVDLHLTNYWSEPRSPVGADLIEEQVSRKLRETVRAKKPE